MFWQITSYPRCRHHVFLSHCAIDRPWLVHPVHEELQRKLIVPWLDRDDYYYGRPSRTALRDGLLYSRHVVYFVTLGMMDYKRGWCALEAAYGDLLQSNFAYSGREVLNYELALFFLDRADPELPRTIWDKFCDNGPFYRPADGDPVEWTVNRISAFLHQQQELALDMVKEVRPGAKVHKYLADQGGDGLLQRVTQFDPSPIP